MNKKESAASKNLFYNYLYQIVIMVIPLILAPYVSRVLGATGIGIHSYTYSIVYYFILFCMLGVSTYGNRSIAKVRDNKEELSKTFWEIYSFQFIMGMLMMTLYFVYILFFNTKYKIISIIQALYLLNAVLDINWLLFGLEKFKTLLTRSIIIRIIIIILVFCFVKTPNDVWKYSLILSGMSALISLCLWWFVRKEIYFVKITKQGIIKHIKPNVFLFVSVIAASIYKMMDKLMLGSMVNVTEVGLYENAEKIIAVPINLITVIGNVMLPRISNSIAKKRKKEANNYFEKSLQFSLFISFAMCFGLCAISSRFVPLYFGKGFNKTSYLINILSITIPIIAISSICQTHYLIPREKDNIYVKSVIYGAIINLIANFLLIPKLSSVGASLGTIFAELVLMLYQVLYINKKFKLKKILLKNISFFFKSIIMFFVIYLLNFININSFVILSIQIIIGISIYFILNKKYIYNIFNVKSFRALLNKVITFIH